MQLILMRHAEAEDGERYADDSLRPLTARGRKVQTHMAQALRRMEYVPDRIIASPRLRAVQTAEICADVWNLKHALTQHDALGANYSADAALAMLCEHDADATLLCVGHDPDLRQFAGALLGMTNFSNVKFPKSAALGLEFRAQPQLGAGVLRFFYRPRDLLALL